MKTRNIADCDIRLQNAFNKAKEIWLERHPELHPFIIVAYRDDQEQNADFAVGRDAEGHEIGKIITKARAGESPHNVPPPNTQAFDMGFQFRPASGGPMECDWSREHFIEFNEIIQEIDPLIVYGGNFRTMKGDNDHWETPDWKEFRKKPASS